jgi:hypothetical protein
MRRPLALPLLTALLLLLALALALASREGDATPPATTSTIDLPAVASPTEAPATSLSARTTADPAPSPSATEPVQLRTYPAKRASSLLAGRVTDHDGIPVPDAEVRLHPSFGGLHPLLAIADDRTTPPPTRTAADGTFQFERVDDGPVRVVAIARDGREGQKELSAPHAPHELPVHITLGRAPASPDLTILVLEPDAATPVQAAHVVVHRLTDLRSIVDETDVPLASVATDEQGRVVVANAPRDALFVLARDDAGRASAQVIQEASGHQPRREVQLALVAVTTVRGTFVGVDEARIRGSRVRALFCRNPSQSHYTCEGFAWSVPVEGLAFSFHGLPAGTWRYARSTATPA